MEETFNTRVKKPEEALKLIKEIYHANFKREICGFIGSDRETGEYIVQQEENIAPDPSSLFLINPLNYLLFKDTYDMVAIFHNGTPTTRPGVAATSTIGKHLDRIHLTVRSLAQTAVLRTCRRLDQPTDDLQALRTPLRFQRCHGVNALLRAEEESTAQPRQPASRPLLFREPTEPRYFLQR